MRDNSSAQTGSHATVRTVDRALDILLCFTHHDGGLSLSDIAREVDLHKSTVHRILMSLQNKGFVRKHPHSEKYLLGWSVLELVGSVFQSDELASIVLPEMTRLRDMTQETVSLYIRSGLQRIRIQALESTEAVRTVASIGKTYPLYIGASGKVILAYSDKSLVEEVLEDADGRVVVHREEFYAQLEHVRESGFATSIQERDSGAAALAVPVFSRDSGFIAAISISGPVQRLTPEKMSEYIEPLKRSAALITKLLTHWVVFFQTSW